VSEPSEARPAEVAPGVRVGYVPPGLWPVDDHDRETWPGGPPTAARAWRGADRQLNVAVSKIGYKRLRKLYAHMDPPGKEERVTVHGRPAAMFVPRSSPESPDSAHLMWEEHGLSIVVAYRALRRRDSATGRWDLSTGYFPGGIAEAMREAMKISDGVQVTI
jgi:hypothetical protein